MKTKKTIPNRRGVPPLDVIQYLLATLAPEDVVEMIIPWMDARHPYHVFGRDLLMYYVIRAVDYKARGYADGSAALTILSSQADTNALLKFNMTVVFTCLREHFTLQRFNASH